LETSSHFGPRDSRRVTREDSPGAPFDFFSPQTIDFGRIVGVFLVETFQ